MQHWLTWSTGWSGLGRFVESNLGSYGIQYSGRGSNTLLAPIFDIPYHDFLVITVVENIANTFAADVAPFGDLQGIFPSWFCGFSADINHSPLNLSVPDFSVFMRSFANDSSLYLDKFYAALEKMGRLGVQAKHLPATKCEDCCGNPLQTDEDTLQCVGYSFLFPNFELNWRRAGRLRHSTKCYSSWNYNCIGG